MKQNKASYTAEGMVLVRAVEASKPEEERICYDPMACSLTSGIKLALCKLLIDSGIYERIMPGVLAYIAVRERYIDDFLKDCLLEGFDQIVILGAGFDTRAYRIPEIEKTRVFEIDHPATQAVKLKRLQKVINPLPDYVTFVPVDLNTQTLGERLLASGYNEQGKTLFIWQGVTMYLTLEGINSTLSFIADHSGSRSAVIFDYCYSKTLQEMNMKIKTAQWILRMIGERVIFGIDEGQIEPFLSQRGFQDVHNVTSDDLKRLYLTGTNAKRAILTGVGIVTARVNKSNE